MHTKSPSSLPVTEASRNQLKLLAYAVASALLPYAAATVLILFGQSQ